MKPTYYIVIAFVEGADPAPIVYQGKGAAVAGRLAADLVRFGLASEATVKGHDWWSSRNEPTHLGQVLLSALAAHKAGVA